MEFCYEHTSVPNWYEKIFEKKLHWIQNIRLIFLCDLCSKHFLSSEYLAS
jgi:hypothetical protein